MNTDTINKKALALLPAFVCPPTYHLQREPGCGCYLDPPGFPSYFLQSVYTQYGNSPRRGAEYVILGRVFSRAENYEDHEKRESKLRKLWNPLPLEHPRTQAWIQTLFCHFQHCYEDIERPEYGKPGTLIYPVPTWRLKAFHDDPRFSDTWRAKERAAVEQANAEEETRSARIATWDNHRAVKMIRRYYPDFDRPDSNEYGGRASLMKGGATQRGDWWETEAEQPTPETCRPRSLGPHPINGTWCQWCGWRKETA